MVAVFFVVAAFFGLAAAGALDLVTRPDLVLPRTRETSLSTAGAALVFLGLLALALGLAAAFLVVVVVLVFFAAAGFLAVVVLAF